MRNLFFCSIPQKYYGVFDLSEGYRDSEKEDNNKQKTIQ